MIFPSFYRKFRLRYGYGQGTYMYFQMLTMSLNRAENRYIYYLT